jgi:hypothetical protein
MISLKWFKAYIGLFMFYSSGGGDDDSAEQAAADEAKKQAARVAVNRLFGIGTDAPRPVMPTLDQFTAAPVVASNTLYSGIAGIGAAQPQQNPLATVNMPAYQEAMRIYKEKEAAYKPNNVIKAAREAQYKDAADTVYKFNTDDLDRNATREGRNLKFELARRGLTAGSEDINQNQRFGELYDKGRLLARNAADSTSAELKAKDEGTRLNLINTINAGTDAGTAISAANNALVNNIASVKADNMGETIGNVFENSSLISKMGQYANQMTPQQIQAQNKGFKAPSVSSNYGGSTNRY